MSNISYYKFKPFSNACMMCLCGYAAIWRFGHESTEKVILGDIMVHKIQGKRKLYLKVVLFRNRYWSLSHRFCFANTQFLISAN